MINYHPHRLGAEPLEFVLQKSVCARKVIDVEIIGSNNKPLISTSIPRKKVV
jgi:hypothetical protein